MSNPWLERRVMVYAHQGGALEAPSSTIYAMEQAVANGAHALELDVHCTKDNVLVLCHDDTVDATTDGAGAIRDMTFAELSALDNAYRFEVGGRFPFRGRARDDPRFRIPSLREVLRTFEDVFINLDIKETGRGWGYEELLASVIREEGAVERVIVASFHDSAIEKFKAVAPEIATSAPPGYVAALYFSHKGNSPLPPPGLHVAVQIPPSFGGEQLATEPFVAFCHQAGLAVHVWTINDEEEARALVEMGVDAVMTDVPKKMVSLMKKLGLYYDGPSPARR